MGCENRLYYPWQDGKTPLHLCKALLIVEALTAANADVESKDMVSGVKAETSDACEK